MDEKDARDEEYPDEEDLGVTPQNPSDHEDRRRPKALVPYVALWIICVLCVIFALVAMLNQG